MKVNTYLNFPGNCLEAMNFYEKNLGAKILMKSTYAEMSSQGAPQNLPPGLNRDGIIHARFALGDTTVMASDGPKVEPMRSAYLTFRSTPMRRRSASTRRLLKAAKSS